MGDSIRPVYKIDNKDAYLFQPEHITCWRVHNKRNRVIDNATVEWNESHDVRHPADIDTKEMKAQDSNEKNLNSPIIIQAPKNFSKKKIINNRRNVLNTDFYLYFITFFDHLPHIDI